MTSLIGPSPAREGNPPAATELGVSPKDSESLAIVPDAEVRRDPAKGTITFLKSENLSRVLEREERFRKLQERGAAPEIALAFLDAYKELFRLKSPHAELVVKSSATDELGLTHVRFEQAFQGIPIWGAEILVHLDRAKHVSLKAAISRRP